MKLANDPPGSTYTYDKADEILAVVVLVLYFITFLATSYSIKHYLIAK